MDDIAIGDAGAGVAATSDRRHGGVYVIFGRRSIEPSESTTAPVSTTIPFGGEVTYTLTGLLPDGDSINATANVSVDNDSYVELNPTSNAISFLVRPTLRGDVDGDGEVNLADFSILANNFGQTDAAFADGDLDGNHEVNFLDFLVLAENFGRQLR